MRATSLIVFGVVFLVAIAFALVPNANSETDTGSCSDCHDSVLSERTSHFIDTEDDCLFCHETDIAGGEIHAISFGENDLCVACHVEQDRMDTTDVHGSLNCIECHNPHGSNHAYSFSTESVSLCAETCHTSDQLGNSHAIGEGVFDMQTGEDMTCISTCHSIHKPRDVKLLQVVGRDGLCIQCHDDKY